MFDWRHYLDFARTLVSSRSGGSEASHPAAASRAYYAAFHKAREVLENEMRATFGRDRIHAEVIRQLKERERWQNVGQNLERVWKHRQHADYNSERDFELRQAEMAVELASDVVSDVQSQR